MTQLQLDDSSIYWQVCYFCTNAVETIISQQAIVDSSDVFQSWHQTGYRCGVSTPGCLRFDSHDGLLTMSMTLVLHDGLHYCYCPMATDAYAVDTMPASRFSPAVRQVACPATLSVPGKSRSHELSMTGGGVKVGYVYLLSIFTLLYLGEASKIRNQGTFQELRNSPFTFQEVLSHFLNNCYRTRSKLRRDLVWPAPVWHSYKVGPPTTTYR
jgi:hypothetical protein